MSVFPRIRKIINVHWILIYSQWYRGFKPACRPPLFLFEAKEIGGIPRQAKGLSIRHFKNKVEAWNRVKIVAENINYKEERRIVAITKVNPRPQLWSISKCFFTEQGNTSLKLNSNNKTNKIDRYSLNNFFKPNISRKYTPSCKISSYPGLNEDRRPSHLQVEAVFSPTSEVLLDHNTAVTKLVCS